MKATKKAPKGTAEARFSGDCELCGKRYEAGMTIKHDGMGWGHSRCVNSQARAIASQNRLDANADLANSRKWQTS